MATTQVALEGDVYTGLQLSDKEEALLQRHLGFIAYGNDFLNNLFRDEYNVIKGGLQVAKAELGGQEFTGMYAGDSEIGLQLIRPAHVLRTTGTTETVTNSWSITLASGNQNWVGFGTNYATATTIDKRICVVPLGVYFTQAQTPVVEELYVQLGGTTYPVTVVRHAWLADNINRIRAARIRPMIWKPKARPLVQINTIAAQINEMVLAGITFGLGDILRTVSPTGSPQT